MSDVLAKIDEEISKLKQARALLSDAPDMAEKPTRGRPKGSKNVAAETAKPTPAAKKGKRQLSPEGRKAIADAMKRRWAERRKEAGK